MNNKVIIKLIVPELNVSFDVAIPVNESIWKVKKLLLKSIQDLSNGILNSTADYVLINLDNSKIYKNNELIINTDIRNTTKLMLLPDIN